MTSSVRISAVIPCRNEASRIEACVRSVLAQRQLAHDFEVIVADGLSDDGTRGILDGIAAEDDRLRVISNPARITPAGMNAGVSAARGEYVAIMGAHNRYAPDYLARCLDVAETFAADNVGGVVIAEPNGYVERAIAAAHHHRLSAGGSRWHSADYEGPTPSVWGGFYRRAIFDQIGLFDEGLVRNQDDELNLRLQKAGGTMWQSARIKSWYRPRSSLWGLFSQYRQYGYWKVHVIRKHRGVSLPRHVVPALFVVGGGTSLPVSTWKMLRAWHGLNGTRHPWFRATAPTAVIAVPYLTLVCAASVTAARTDGWDLLPLLPAVFACFHVGYGVGFIAGTIDVLRNRPAPSTMSRLTR